MNNESFDVQALLDRFVEGLFLLVLDHHHRHVMETELTMVQAQALRLIGETPVTTTNLASALGISSPAATQLTDRLVIKRLIERRRLESDRRSVTVELSERGRRLINDFRRRRNAIFGEVLQRLEAEDKAEIFEALEKLARVLEPDEIRKSEDKKPARARAKPQPRPPRTPVEPPATSKQVEPAKTVPVRRMRIEWD